MHIPGNAFTGQRAGVQGGIALHYDTVQRDFFPGPHHDQAADGNFLRIGLLLSVFRFHPGEIRPDIHQRADILPAFSDSVALEELADLVEKHHGHGLVKIPGFQQADGQGAEGGDSHQEVFIEHLPVQDPPERFPQDVIPNDSVGNQVQQHPGKALQQAAFPGPRKPRKILRQEMQDHQQRRGDADADQHLLLFLRHGLPPKNNTLYR